MKNILVNSANYTRQNSIVIEISDASDEPIGTHPYNGSPMYASKQGTKKMLEIQGVKTPADVAAHLGALGMVAVNTIKIS